MKEAWKDRVRKLEARIGELEAVEAVRSTILAYALAHDRGQSDVVADLFAEDAVLMPYYDGQYDVHGRDGGRCQTLYLPSSVGGGGWE